MSSPDDGSGSHPPLNLRALGRVRILELLVGGDPIPRMDLARRTGLARATVQSLINDLIGEGLVRETGAQRSAGAGRTGRPAYPLAITSDAAFVFGIDLGHDHVQTRLCNLVGASLWERTASINVDNDADLVLDCVADHVGSALHDTGTPAADVLAAGLAIASPVDDHGELRAEHIMPAWADRRPDLELAQRVGLDVHLINDADAGLLGERRFGSARDCDDVIYLRLSSGIGAGVVCNGHVLTGSAGLVGELGHLIVEPGGALCRCGNRGCLETVAGTRAVAAALGRATRTHPSTSELLARTAAGEPAAVEAITNAAERIGVALALAVAVLNPARIVVGGDLAAAGSILLDPVAAAIRRETMSALTEDLDLRVGELGDNAPGFGAAALVLARSPRALAQRARA